MLLLLLLQPPVTWFDVVATSLALSRQPAGRSFVRLVRNGNPQVSGLTVTQLQRRTDLYPGNSSAGSCLTSGRRFCSAQNTVVLYTQPLPGNQRQQQLDSELASRSTSPLASHPEVREEHFFSFRVHDAPTTGATEVIAAATVKTTLHAMSSKAGLASLVPLLLQSLSCRYCCYGCTEVDYDHDFAVVRSNNSNRFSNRIGFSSYKEEGTRTRPDLVGVAWHDMAALQQKQLQQRQQQLRLSFATER